MHQCLFCVAAKCVPSVCMPHCLSCLVLTYTSFAFHLFTGTPLAPGHSSSGGQHNVAGSNFTGAGGQYNLAGGYHTGGAGGSPLTPEMNGGSQSMSGQGRLSPSVGVEAQGVGSHLSQFNIAAHSAQSQHDHTGREVGGWQHSVGGGLNENGSVSQMPGGTTDQGQHQQQQLTPPLPLSHHAITPPQFGHQIRHHQNHNQNQMIAPVPVTFEGEAEGGRNAQPRARRLFSAASAFGMRIASAVQERWVLVCFW